MLIDYLFKQLQNKIPHSVINNDVRFPILISIGKLAAGLAAANADLLLSPTLIELF